MKKILCVLLLLLTATLTFAETTKENACNFSRPGDGFERIARRCNIDLKDLEKIMIYSVLGLMVN